MAKTLIITREHLHPKMTGPIVTTTKGAGLEISRTMAHTTKYPRDIGIAMTIRTTSAAKVAMQ
jgi:hypothetical protein